MKSIVLLIGIFGIFGSEQATDYCNSNLCRYGITHIGCKNPGNFASTCPSDRQLVNMNANLKYAIVKRHNINRNTLAAGKLTIFEEANQMATMSWNDELAYLAELNVKRCAFGYDRCHNTASFKYSGQNIALARWSTAPPTDESAILVQIDIWWAKNQYASMENIRRFVADEEFTENRIGPFMLMASDRNIAVGCAAIKYKDPNIFFWSTYLFTCNYARANLGWATTYVTGPATSNCTTGKNANYPALCSPDEPIDPNSYIIVVEP